MAFHGERTPVVGRPGVRDPNRPLPLVAGLLEGDVARPGGDRCEAWESAIGIGSIICRMQLMVMLWDNLVGADGVELSMAADCGVLGEDSKAMDVILAQELVDKGWGCRKGLEWQGGRGLLA